MKGRALVKRRGLGGTSLPSSPCQRVYVGAGGRWEYCMWLSFLGFFTVTVKGGVRQSLEVGGSGLGGELGQREAG